MRFLFIASAALTGQHGRTSAGTFDADLWRVVGDLWGCLLCCWMRTWEFFATGKRGGRGFNGVAAYFVYVLGLCSVRLNRGR
jgi:hypothetical protein